MTPFSFTTRSEFAARSAARQIYYSNGWKIGSRRQPSRRQFK